MFIGVNQIRSSFLYRYRLQIGSVTDVSPSNGVAAPIAFVCVFISICFADVQLKRHPLQTADEQRQ